MDEKKIVFTEKKQNNEDEDYLKPPSGVMIGYPGGGKYIYPKNESEKN